jgi:hypothetical protein
MTANKPKSPKEPKQPTNTKPLTVRSGVRAGLGNKIWQDDWLAPV